MVEHLLGSTAGISIPHKTEDTVTHRAYHLSNINRFPSKIFYFYAPDLYGRTTFQMMADGCESMARATTDGSYRDVISQSAEEKGPTPGLPACYIIQTEHRSAPGEGWWFHLKWILPKWVGKRCRVGCEQAKTCFALLPYLAVELSCLSEESHLEWRRIMWYLSSTWHKFFVLYPLSSVLTLISIKIFSLGLLLNYIKFSNKKLWNKK